MLLVGLGLVAAGLVALCGCPPLLQISVVSTTCEPVAVGVGESISLDATVADEGEIPTYSWNVISVDPPPNPSDEVVGSFTSQTKLEARFTPSIEGEFLIRFTGSDGLFSDSRDCPVITVAGRARVVVRLEFEPETPMVNRPIALTCSNNDGETEAVTFEILQILSPLPPDFVEFRDLPDGPGRVGFAVSVPGSYLFSCTGTNAEGDTSALVTLEVDVGGTAGNSNGNENVNGNDNSDVNQNDNQTGMSDNENANDNASANANDNG